jgi:vacuole morphology and inheritance protein 14
MEAFITLTRHYLVSEAPHVRLLMVDWLLTLYTIPDFNILDYLPEFLGFLFTILSDTSSASDQIRSSAKRALRHFLDDIEETELRDYSVIVRIVLDSLNNSSLESRIRSITLQWLEVLISLASTKLSGLYPDLLLGILRCVSSPIKEGDAGDGDDEDNEDNAGHPATAESDSYFLLLASHVNDALLGLVRSTPLDQFDLQPLIVLLKGELGAASGYQRGRVLALRWVSALFQLDSDPQDLHDSIEIMLPSLVHLLSDADQEVVLIDLEVLATVSKTTIGQDDYYARVINLLVNVFAHDHTLLERRGPLIIRNLCALLGCCDRIFMSFSAIVNDWWDQSKGLEETSANNSGGNTRENSVKNESKSSGGGLGSGNSEKNGIGLFRDLQLSTRGTSEFVSHENLDFCNVLVNILNLVLLTAPEVEPLRETLKRSRRVEASAGDRETFSTLFCCWCHSPVAAISLCLVSQAFELSEALVHSFARFEATVGMLVQIGKLIEFLQGPALVHVKLTLLQDSIIATSESKSDNVEVDSKPSDSEEMGAMDKGNETYSGGKSKGKGKGKGKGNRRGGDKNDSASLGKDNKAGGRSDEVKQVEAAQGLDTVHNLQRKVALLKTLCGLMMILPQGRSYDMICQQLSMVGFMRDRSFGLAHLCFEEDHEANVEEDGDSDDSEEEIIAGLDDPTMSVEDTNLLELYYNLQQHHADSATSRWVI